VKINIYTDGACSGNQNESNIGGWGTILEAGENQKELYGGAQNTTNNIMELTAVLEGLKALKSHQHHVRIYSDSAYIVNCFNQKWYLKWQSNGWKTSQKKPVENKDLWAEIIGLVNQIQTVQFYKVKGHLELSKQAEVKKWYEKFAKAYGSVPMNEFEYLIKMNHRADELANLGMDAYR
jgi:ribonuclease HI